MRCVQTSGLLLAAEFRAEMPFYELSMLKQGDDASL